MRRPPSSAGRPLYGPLSTRTSPAEWARYARVEPGALVARCGDHAADRQPELLGECVVPFVVRRDRHDRAGPVAGQDVVGDEDRDPLAVHGVDRIGPDRDAGLLAVGRQAVDLGAGGRLRDIGLDLGSAVRTRQRRDQRVLGREDHERGPEQRVGPGGEDAQLLATGMVLGRRRREDDLAALRPADPVGLHHPDRLREVDAAVVEQLVGVLRDAQVPLVELALLDLRAAPPAVPVGAFDLLAGERPVVRAPVDRRLGSIGQPGLQEPQEQPLVPLVVLGIAGHDLRRPVEGGAHRPELAAHVVDVAHRPFARVEAALDRGVLGRQPEGVEADRQEDVLAVHPLEPGEGVGRRDDVPVADVQVARRVRIHRQQVVAIAGRGQVRVVHAELVPARLPARLEGARVVALDAGARLGRLGAGGVGGVGVGHVVLGDVTPPAAPARGERSAERSALMSRLVELRGLEPRTPCMPCRCSSS